jgi:hypothetical protein
VPRFAPAVTTVMFWWYWLCPPASHAAQRPVGLGTVGAFALLAGSSATNSG